MSFIEEYYLQEKAYSLFFIFMQPTCSVYSNAHFVKKKKKKKNLLELPAALYLALSLAVGHHRCIFQSEPVRTHSHSRLVNRRQLQIFSMPNISRATHRRFPQIASLIIHTARLSLAGTSTDLPPISGICWRFIKTCRRVKNRAKIVQCELGIMPSSHCTIFKLVGSPLSSHCRTIWGRIQSLLFSHCTMDPRQGVSHCTISQ